MPLRRCPVSTEARVALCSLTWPRMARSWQSPPPTPSVLPVKNMSFVGLTWRKTPNGRVLILEVLSQMAWIQDFPRISQVKYFDSIRHRESQTFQDFEAPLCFQKKLQGVLLGHLLWRWSRCVTWKQTVDPSAFVTGGLADGLFFFYYSSIWCTDLSWCERNSVYIYIYITIQYILMLAC